MYQTLLATDNIYSALCSLQYWVGRGTKLKFDMSYTCSSLSIMIRQLPLRVHRQEQQKTLPSFLPTPQVYTLDPLHIWVEEMGY